MSKLGTYRVILPKSPHIDHTFATFKEAEDWMHQASATGYIAFLVGRVITKTETSDVGKKLVNYIDNLVTEPEASHE